MSTFNCGTFSEEGILKSFYSKGFTYSNCLNEILANSVDAKSTLIKIIINPNEILIKDNGIGMNNEKINQMFDLWRSNHENDQSIGVAGIGGKIATCILSEKSPVYIYTKEKDKQTYQVTIPWDDIYKNFTYIGKVNYEIIDDQRINSMIGDSGTIIKFNFLESLYDEIISLFNGDYNEIDYMNKSPHIIYAKYNVEFEIENNWEKHKVITSYPKYKPFELDDSKFINGKMNVKIHLYKENKKDLIHILGEYDNKYYIYAPINKQRCKTKESIYVEFPQFYLKEYNKIGEMELNIGMLNDANYLKYLDNTYDFDKHKFTCSNYLFDYDKERNLQFEDKGIILDTFIYRNNHLIGYGPKLTNSSTRANFEGRLKAFVKSELKYNVYSTGSNIIDHEIGIQENKQQFIWSNIQLERIIKFFHKMKTDNIIEYFKKHELHLLKKNTDLNVKNNDETHHSETSGDETKLIGNYKKHKLSVSSESEIISDIENESDTLENIESKPKVETIRGILGSDIKKNLSKFIETINDDTYYSDNYITINNLLLRNFSNSINL